MFHWRDSENCVVRIQRAIQSPGLWQTTRCDCRHPLRDTRVNEGGKKSECVWHRNYWKIQIERQSETRPWAAMKCRALPQLGGASQPGCAGGRILWFQRQSVSRLHSRGGWKASQYPRGSKMPSGQQMSDFGGRGTGGWVHGVSFSVSGSCLAWVIHDGTVAIADASKTEQVSTLETQFLPLLSGHLSQRIALPLQVMTAAQCSLTTMTVAAGLLGFHVQTRRSKPEPPVQHSCHGSLPQHRQEGHDCRPQHSLGDAAPEEHHSRVCLRGRQERLLQILHYWHRWEPWQFGISVR